MSVIVTTSLFLSKGEVPPEIEHLINLEDLNLSRNLLTGELPHELGQLANLKTLILFGNKFILPNGITNKAEGHLHILSDATKVKFLMKKLFQASDKDSGSSAILAAARARRLAAEESDRRAVENARASRVIGCGWWPSGRASQQYGLVDCGTALARIRR